MHKFLFAVCLSVALAAIGSATVITPCSGFNLNQNCQVGIISFSNFGIANVSTNNALGTQITNSNINYTVSYNDTTGIISITFSSLVPLVQSTGNQTSFNVQFSVSTNPASTIFSRVAASQVSGTTGGTASDQLAKTLCDNSGFNTFGACNGTQYTVPSLSTTDTINTAGPVALPNLSSFRVNDNVQVAGGSISSPGTATLTSWTNSFTVPEPMSLSLMGAGLLAVGFLGRRVRR